jgi:hypothetical protein
MNQTEIKEALDKAIISMDSVIHHDYQLPLDYVTDTLVHMKYLLESLRSSMPSDDQLDYDKPQTTINNIKAQAEFIKSYSEEIKRKGVIA